MMRNIGKLLLAGVLAMSLCFAVIGCTGGGTTGKSQYDVYYMSDAAYTITGEKTVKAGEDYMFTVTPTAGWDASAMKVTANGKTLTAKDGKYTVAKVEDTLAIYVTGIVAPAAPETEYVNITFEGEHVDFTGDSQVEKGEDYTFTAVAYDGYTLGEVKNGEEVLTADENGVYTIEEAAEDLTITATATKNQAVKVSKGKGASVTVDDNNVTHLSVAYNAEDREYNGDKTELFYTEVGFTLSSEAWAAAPKNANLAILTLRLNSWGEDVSADIGSSWTGITLVMVENGMANLGENLKLGNMPYPDFNSTKFAEGSVITLELSKTSQFFVRLSNGFDASVINIEYKSVSKIHVDGACDGGATYEGVIDIAMDEDKEVLVRTATWGNVVIDVTKILGDECKGKTIKVDVIRLDDAMGDNRFNGVLLKAARTGSFEATVSDEGTIKLELAYAYGLTQLHFSIVA